MSTYPSVAVASNRLRPSSPVLAAKASVTASSTLLVAVPVLQSLLSPSLATSARVQAAVAAVGSGGSVVVGDTLTFAPPSEGLDDDPVVAESDAAGLAEATHGVAASPIPIPHRVSFSPFPRPIRTRLMW
jgi:hypothetical protein